MNTNSNNTLLYCIMAIIIFAVIVAVLYTVRRKRVELVKASSNKLKLVKQLNSRYHFYPILSTINIHKQCLSKREFERLDLKDYLVVQILQNRSYYLDIIAKVNKNCKTNQSYNLEYASLMQTDSIEDQSNYAKYSFFQKEEERLCKNAKLSPAIDVLIRIEKSYISAKGRNVYRAYRDFHQNDLIDCYNLAGESTLHRLSVKYQRELMTDSLRYDVMKRDGFKCVICGASARDGIKLHVDHILPVSNGGKTEMSNLRTLCDRCNLGKSAKYDPNGLN